jgi:hypothetical protein
MTVLVLIEVYVVSKSGTEEAIELTDTSVATVLLPDGPIIIPSGC